jgi:hypothetical protein
LEGDLNTKENIDVSEFNKLLSLWKGVYKWKATSFVAIKKPDGAKLLIGRVIFDSIKPQDSSRFSLETTHLIADREISGTTIEDIDTCIKNAIEGKLTSSNQIILLHQKSGESLSTTFFPTYHPSVTFGPRLPSIIIRGSSKHDLLSAQFFRPNEMLDFDLRSAAQPFDGLDDLFIHLGFPVSRQSGDFTVLEIIATSPALIADDSKITAGYAQIKCKLAEAADIKKIKFGYKIFHENSIERGNITGDALEWIMDGHLKTGSASISTKNAPVLQGFLSYDGILLHQWWVTDPLKRLNERHAIYEVFDEELKLLKDFLLSHAGKEDRAFEHGIALLLNILGFSVSHHGTIKKLEKGPDIIAASPISGNVGVIECTTGLLNENDKLSKLAQRTTLVKVTKAGYGHINVQPVIISALRRNEIEADIELAGKTGIAVVCKENIEELLNRVTLPPNPDALFQEAQQLIPRTEQPPLFPE